MNTYQINSGRFYDGSGVLLGSGYSGGECGKTPAAVNNPDYMNVQNVGPLPVGFYHIGSPEDTVTHGPYVLPLTPNEGNQMFGRSGFLIHGDSVIEPGKQAASDGCIILPRDVRLTIWNSGDHDLQVTSGETLAT